MQICNSDSVTVRQSHKTRHFTAQPHPPGDSRQKSLSAPPRACEQWTNCKNKETAKESANEPPPRRAGKQKRRKRSHTVSQTEGEEEEEEAEKAAEEGRGIINRLGASCPAGSWPETTCPDTNLFHFFRASSSSSSTASSAHKYALAARRH